jgi:DNA-binding transcriptional ArsR family regulator
MPADLKALESLFLGLADKTRLRLLALMAEGPVSVGYLVAETAESQPKISRHLAYLRNAGLVDTTRDGKWIYYGVSSVADETADSVFRCVVNELSGGSGKQHAPSSRTNLPQSQIATSDRQYDAEGYVRDQADPDEMFNTEAWGDHSEERSGELEIFLL